MIYFKRDAQTGEPTCTDFFFLIKADMPTINWPTVFFFCKMLAHSNSRTTAADSHKRVWSSVVCLTSLCAIICYCSGSSLGFLYKPRFASIVRQKLLIAADLCLTCGEIIRHVQLEYTASHMKRERNPCQRTRISLEIKLFDRIFVRSLLTVYEKLIEITVVKRLGRYYFYKSI